MNKLAAGAALALSLLGGSAVALPLVTDDAGVIDEGRSEFETIASHARQSGSPSVRGYSVALSGGIGFGTQLGVAVERAKAGGDTEHALAVGGKTQLIEQEDSRPGFAVSYGFDLVRPSGLAWRHAGSAVTLIATQPITEALFLHANLGWSRSELERLDSTTWNVALEYDTGADITLALEAFGDDRAKPVLLTGALWQLTPAFSLSATYGSERKRPRISVLMVGLKLEF